MNKEITIVTAFFSINRESWKGFQRSDELYFDYFKGWARLKNKIIVYTDKAELRSKILDFRESIGLKDNTLVIVVPDIIDIEPNLYSEMVSTANNPVHQLYRLFPKHPEVWNAKYDYVMLLKMWCCADAVSKGYAEGMIAWMDFGYNHGGAVIDSSSDFNFLWTYDFQEKINVFLIQELDNRPIFDIILSMDTYIMGMMLVAPAHLWEPFWQMMKKNMRSLLQVGIIDDDQNIILMCIRESPELFNTYKSSWQMPLKEFGGNHLRLSHEHSRSQQVSLFSYLKLSIVRYRHKWFCAKYALRVYNYLKRITIH